MRFHVAMDSLEKENKILRISVIGLLILAIVLCLGILKTSQKNPLLVERGCQTSVLVPTNSEVTESEMLAFLTSALSERFNAKTQTSLFLSFEQMTARNKEQFELSRQNLKQTVFINEVRAEGKEIIVDADRLISVGDIRSAFKFPIKVKIETIARSAENPYGLVLVGVFPHEQKARPGKDGK